MAKTLSASLAIDGTPFGRVVHFVETHALGRPPTLEIDLRIEAPVPLDVMVGHLARLDFGFDDDSSKRAFCGVVEQAAVYGSSIIDGERTHEYSLRVVPRLALTARSVGCRIFQDKTVPDIVKEILKDNGVAEDAQEFRLTGSYEPRDFCVQYRESVLDFVHRLLEEEGIYYYVDPGDEGEKVVFLDDSTNADPIEGDPALPLRGRTGMQTDAEFVLSLAEEERVRSGKFVLRDYDFERPALDMTATSEGATDADLEVYDYPGGYFDPGIGKKFAQVRREAEEVRRKTIEVEAHCPRLNVGRTFTLSDAADAEGDYTVIALVQEWALAGGGTSRGGDKQQRYAAKATCVQKATPFRTALETPRPVIEGPQTATVVGPPGAEPETIHTDEHGRIKVKFHWDLAEPTDDKASFWFRTTQLQTSGSMVLPRIDWEVIIEFLEGNPDRPIVTGRLYNGTYMPPYALPEGKTRTSVRTHSTPGGGGSNEIRFEDKAGSEEIMIHAQKDMLITAANNAKKQIGNNQTTVIGNNSSLKVGAKQEVKVTQGTKASIDGDQSVSVSGNRKVSVNAVNGLVVAGDALTKIGGDLFEQVGNPLEGLLAVASQRAQAYLQAQADRMVDRVAGHVQGMVDQALGPINNVINQGSQISQAMQGVANGDPSGAVGLAAQASGMPQASQIAGALGATAPPPGANPVADAAASAMEQGTAMAHQAARAGVAAGVGAARNALAGALGLDAAAAAGQSGTNVAGPPGNVDGLSETDRTKGPGHSTSLIAGDHGEKVGGMKIMGVLNGMDTNATGDLKRDVSAAEFFFSVGQYAESVGADKTESALGLVVLSKAGESEAVKGSKTSMVGGLVYDKLKGSHSITSKGPATFIGAFHKFEAKTKITFKTGGSEFVIDGSGVTIKSKMIIMLAAKIQAPKKVAEGP